MKAYVFPGQGAQFVGMGQDLYNSSSHAKDLFEKANKILGFKITELMFNGTDEDLRQTKVTQPAIFLHSVILAHALGDSFKPDMVAGHSLGEFSALVAAGAISFEDGLRLVAKRAAAMQSACELEPSTMAAIVGLEDAAVEKVIQNIKGEVVVAANYNCPGQLVISGSIAGIDIAIELLTAAGARRAMKLNVGGAFHSPLMDSARKELAKAIDKTKFVSPICPIYQNVTGQAVTNAEIIKENLISQLTSPVRWTQTMKNMLANGMREYIEVGPGQVLQGLLKKVDRQIPTSSASIN